MNISESTESKIEAKEIERNNLLQEKSNETNPERKLELEKAITQIDSQLDSVELPAKRLGEVSPDVETIQEVTIGQIEKQLLQEIKNENPKISRSGVLWFKEGFFLQFENNIRINLDKGKLFKDQGYIEVRVCESTISGCSRTIADNLQIRLNGSGGEFTHNEKKYKINLKAIDRAGKNPFNWAAYITLDSWE